MRCFPILLLLLAEDLNEDLLAAARKGDVAIVKTLLDKGTDVNAKSPYGATPIFFAAQNGHIDVLRLLIERGGDVNLRDTFYGFTAVQRAAAKGNVAVVKLLLDRGA